MTQSSAPPCFPDGPGKRIPVARRRQPQIARNRQTMDFIHVNFGHYFESDPVTGKEIYTGPGDL